MSQIITKLSERRALAKAKKSMKRTVKIFEGISPEAVAGFEAYLAENHPGATPQEAACVLTRRMIAEEVKEYTRKAFPDIDSVAHEMVEAIDGETVEKLLEAMVEGDEILDDAEVHAFHRRKLDELRTTLARIEENERTSLSYDAIRSDFITASTMMDMGVLDKATEARVAHIRVWGQTLTAFEKDHGRVPTADEANEAFNYTRACLMASAYDDHDMSVEEIADALDATVEDVNACLAFLADKGLRSAHH